LSSNFALQSTPSTPPEPFHVAIIMDGNGRWARARGLPRVAGHRQGAKAVRRTVEAAPTEGITTLTLYAFSSDNWNRPAEEVRALMRLLESYLEKESGRCAENGVRLSVIGRRDRLADGIVTAIEEAEELTRACDKLHLRLAIDYSARHAITTAARLCRSRGELSNEEFSRLLGQAIHSDPASPEVDLLIRTSGEQRLSDFLLWECAYAELLFTERLWPDFRGDDLAAAVAAYRSRDRRFGRVAQSG